VKGKERWTRWPREGLLGCKKCKITAEYQSEHGELGDGDRVIHGREDDLAMAPQVKIAE
jgi:hypothetical protein